MCTDTTATMWVRGKSRVAGQTEAADSALDFIFLRM